MTSTELPAITEWRWANEHGAHVQVARVYPVVCIVNTDSRFIGRAARLIRRCCVAAHVQSEKKPRPWRVCYRVTVASAKGAEIILTEVLPFLIIKRKRALAVLRWISARRRARADQGVGNGALYSDETRRLFKALVADGYSGTVYRKLLRSVGRGIPRRRGKGYGTQKISARDAHELRRLRKCGLPLAALAERFGISVARTCMVARGDGIYRDGHGCRKHPERAGGA